MKWNSDSSIICIKCGKRPARFKKRQLCKYCYHKFYESGNIHPLSLSRNFLSSHIKFTRSTEIKYQHKAEILFGQNHPSFLYQPVFFNLGTIKYFPDFYDNEHNIFYEVIGSRQRFEQLKIKIKRFRELFPMIQLNIVCADGNPYHSLKNFEIINNEETPTLFS